MGQLVEQPLKTFFQGVSRQPDTVRLPGQVEDAENVLLSVVTGGFEKRPPTERVAAVPFMDGASDFAIHSYVRDTAEQYIIIVKDDDLAVLDLDGNSKTIAFPDGKTYLDSAAPESDFRFLTILDTTLVGNRKTVTAMTGMPIDEVPIYGPVRLFSELPRRGASIFDYLASYDANADAKWDTGDLGCTDGAIWQVEPDQTTDLGYYYVQLSNRDTAHSDILTSGDNTTGGKTTYKLDFHPDADRDISVVTTGMNGHTITIESDDNAAFSSPVVRATITTDTTTNIASLAGGETHIRANITVAGTGNPKAVATWDKQRDSWTWTETVDPNGDNQFDDTTMPHRLVREADSTFTFQKAIWDERIVGDAVVTPDPEFVGTTINDLQLHRDRLAVLADETVYYSQTGQYFNMFPDAAAQVIATDPVGVTASAPQVSILNYGLPFRKYLLCTSALNQFEAGGGDTLSARTAEMDVSTSYEVSTTARPIALGSIVMLPAEQDDASVVYEYYYEDESQANLGVDVTKHCSGFIPAPLVRLTADTVSGTVACLSSADRDALYIYRYYWEETLKVQSSWSRWQFEVGSTIYWAEFIQGSLYLLIKRGNGSTYLERLRMTPDDDVVGLPYVPRIDWQQQLTGVYDSGTGLTTWTFPEAHDSDIVGVLGGSFPAATKGKLLSLSFPTATTVTALGDYSAGPAVFGRSYDSFVVLSKQYVREAEDERTVTAGRTQMRYISFDYEDSGYFEIHVTPKARTTRVKKFTGRVLGSEDNKIGSNPIESGTIRARVNSRADTVTIAIKNDTHLPHRITSAFWTGFFNELSRTAP